MSTKTTSTEPATGSLVERSRNQLKEAKKLDKILSTIKDLSEWGLAHVEHATAERRKQVTPAAQ